MKNFSDFVAFIGFIFIIIGLSRFVLKLGLFDLTIYSFKEFLKLIYPSKYKDINHVYIDYHDYSRKKKTKNTYQIFLLIGIILVLVSLVIFYIF